MARRALEPAAGGMEEVLTGVGSKEPLAYGQAEVVSVEFLVVRYQRHRTIVRHP